MSSVAMSSSRSGDRPAALEWAVYLTLFSAIVGGPLFFVLPGSDDIPVGAVVAGLVLSAVAIIPCWWLWQGRRWAAIVITLVTALNLLSSLPGLVDPPSGWIAAGIIAFIPVSLVTLWLLWHPASRRAYAA